jgi:CheY-like chemotaxis protein
MQDNEQPFSILIVDDEEMIRSLLRLTLVRAGYHVVEAESGEEGVSIAHKAKPDLVLLDVMMPGIDGFAACEQIRQDPTLIDIPIIMLSARKDPHSRRESQRVGATDYLTKPWVTEELLWRVDRALKSDGQQVKHGTT